MYLGGSNVPQYRAEQQNNRRSCLLWKLHKYISRQLYKNDISQYPHASLRYVHNFRSVARPKNPWEWSNYLWQCHNRGHSGKCTSSFSGFLCTRIFSCSNVMNDFRSTPLFVLTNWFQFSWAICVTFEFSLNYFYFVTQTLQLKGLFKLSTSCSQMAYHTFIKTLITTGSFKFILTDESVIY